VVVDGSLNLTPFFRPFLIGDESDRFFPVLIETYLN
jgi:hypothetical protein